jgi:iron complex transport system substrate-binding protein
VTLNFRALFGLLAFASLALFGLPAGSFANTSGPRVISLSPAISEIIFALHLEKNLVGVSEYSDYPSEAKKIQRVGPYSKPDLERIFLLKPDLVLVPVEGPEDVYQRLDEVKIKYVVLSMKSLDDIGSASRKIGELMGDKRAGLGFEKKWCAHLKRIFSSRKISVKKPQVLIEVQREPLIVAGQDTFLDEIVTKCGAENIFRSEKRYQRVSSETLVTKKADLILMADFFENKKSEARAVSLWREFKPFKFARIEVLNPDISARPGPRLISGVEEICKIIENFN